MDGSTLLIALIAAMMIGAQVRQIINAGRISRARSIGAGTLKLGDGKAPVAGDGVTPEGHEINRSIDGVLHRCHLAGFGLEAGYYARRWEEPSQTHSLEHVVQTRRVVYVEVTAPSSAEEGLRLSNAQGSEGRRSVRDEANGNDVILTDHSARVEYQGHFPESLSVSSLVCRCLKLVACLAYEDEACAQAFLSLLDLDDPTLPVYYEGTATDHWETPLAPIDLQLETHLFELLLDRFPHTSAAREAAVRPPEQLPADEESLALALLVRCEAPTTKQQEHRFRKVVENHRLSGRVRARAFRRLWPTLETPARIRLLNQIKTTLAPVLSNAFFEALPTTPKTAAMTIIEDLLTRGLGGNDGLGNHIFRTLSTMEGPESNAHLYRLLHRAELPLAARICTELVERGCQPRLEDWLIEKLRETDVEVRDFAIIKLGAHGTAKAVPELHALVAGWRVSGPLKEMVKTSVAEIQERATVGAGGLALARESAMDGALSPVHSPEHVGGLSPVDPSE